MQGEHNNNVMVFIEIFICENSSKQTSSNLLLPFFDIISSNQTYNQAIFSHLFVWFIWLELFAWFIKINTH